MTFSAFIKGSLVNLFVLLALVALFGLVRGWFMRQGRAVSPWWIGVLYGIVATMAMLFPVVTGTGMIFDCRSGVIGAAALLHGPAAVLASLPLPLAYRFYVGDPGLLPGLLEIVIPAFLGTVCHFWFGRHRRVLTYWRILTASLIVGFGTNGVIVALILLFMPQFFVDGGSGMVVLIMTNTTVAMAVLSSLVQIEKRHFDAVEAVAESERRMLHSQKMAAIGQLSRKIAHTFVNTFTTILGNAQLAKDRAAGDMEVTRHMDEIIESVGRISFLTGELLSFANPSPLRMRCMDLSKSVTGIKELLAKSIGPEVEIVVNAGNRAGRVCIDPDRIGQAIVHMAVNASEAMADKGRLTITICRADLSERRKQEIQAGIHAKDRHAGDFAMLSVSDTGRGMSEETCAHIFEPFFTTKGKRENAGLGLSSVYNIVQSHNACIDVQSREGYGTTFFIYLPIVEAPRE